jgi:hypothetical protein
MKIIPYSVLAATLIWGMIPAVWPAAVWGDDPGRSVSTEETSATQEEIKWKAADGAGPDASTAAGAEAKTKAADSAQLPVGTTIYAELVKPIDAKKSKAGDPIAARVTLPVLLRGKIAIANDAKIMGHVTEVVTLSGTEGRSRIGILFDRVALKDGTKASIALTVQAVGWHPAPASGEQQGDAESDDLRRPQLHPSGTPGTSMQPGHAPRDSDSRRIPGDEVPPPAPPTLDAGSHGVIGMPDVELIEAKDAGKGSVIESAKKNVRLEIQTELVLRVVAAGDEATPEP